MKDFIKEWLDRLSPKSKAPEVQEAERMNIKYDSKQLDDALNRLQESGSYFAEIVGQVVEGVKQERLERRKHEKVTSRARKT